MVEHTNVIWRDGDLVPFEEATIHVLSHAANRGTEVFDVLRVVETADGPAAVGLRPHVARFDHSMELMGMEPGHDIAALERAVAQTVLANPGSVTVKLVAAWAAVPSGTGPTTRRPTIFVAALEDPSGDGLAPSGRAPAALLRRKPIKVQTATMPKIPASILPPSLKVAAGYAPGIRFQMAAAEAGFDDVIFKTVKGSLAESVTQSQLVVNDGRIAVPSLDEVLDGITRRLLLDMAHHAEVVVQIRDVRWDEVEEADELILTSTNNFIRPLGQLDDRVLDAPGPMAELLEKQLIDLVAGDHPLRGRWLTALRPLTA